MALHFRSRSADHRAIGEAEFATEGVGEELRCQRVEEEIFLFQKLRLQTFDAFELGAVRHPRAGVDEGVVFRRSAVPGLSLMVAPLAGGVEILERKPSGSILSWQRAQEAASR